MRTKRHLNIIEITQVVFQIQRKIQVCRSSVAFCKEKEQIAWKKIFFFSFSKPNVKKHTNSSSFNFEKNFKTHFTDPRHFVFVQTTSCQLSEDF